jgi:manganese/iron transport system ATP-binding protein/manganese/zinc/iron transport system ATP- binding protein
MHDLGVGALYARDHERAERLLEEARAEYRRVGDERRAAEALLWLGMAVKERGERRAAEAALERVGLGAEAGERFGELSGGQRQRALLARALVQETSVLLLDEPLSGVDPASAELIAALYGELKREGRTLLVSTHDVESARSFDLVLCLNRRQVAFGTPREALRRESLEATYGREMIVLQGEEPARAVTVQHHEH